MKHRFFFLLAAMLLMSAGAMAQSGKYVRGDANGDGEIGMPDVMFVVNYILGTPADTFNAEAADANLDGEIGMPDVMFIVNYILNGKFPEERKKAISGVVYSYGMPVSGVKVTAGTISVTTGFNGAFAFEQVSGDFVKFEKEGYATITRKVSKDDDHFDVTLTEVQTTTFASNTAKTLNAWSGGKTMTVDLPASYKKEDGTAYTGNVTASYAYLDPNDSEFAESMPGTLAAIRSDQSEAELVSYGMVAVDLTGDNGEKLQSGAPATLTFLVDPAKMKFTPDIIPLWSYNEESCLWEEEGEAIYNPSLQAYVGTVDHFSWHNLAYPETRASLQVKVMDKDASPIVGIPVDFDGQRISYTNAEGVASCVVPSYTDMVISIESSAYGNYADDEYGWPDPTKIIKQNVNLLSGESKMITLPMPIKAPVISGTVINEGSGSKLCTLWIVYGDGLETSRVVSDLDGKYSIIAPASYRGAAKLVAMYGDASKTEKDIEITDADQTIDLTVNSSAVAGAGLIVVAGEGLNTWYQIPDGNNGVWDGEVSVDDNNTLNAYFSIGGNNKEWGMLNITIPNYFESKTSYVSSSNEFNYFKEGMGGWTQIDCRNGELTIEVTKSGDVYSFKVNGPGTLVDRGLGIDWDTSMPVTVGAEFSIKKTVSE